ncbi:MAG TPA: universal stress protein [Chitinophaga sp.]|uniref:universal stress protein n=1 Tax=Chitinophaga sp. TaxID=1869181 RepID=UPI002F92CAA9
MEKIILLLAGEQPTDHVLSFFHYLSGLGRYRFHVLFFQTARYAEKPALKKALGFPYVESIVAGDLPEYVTKRQEIEDNMSAFINACDKRGLIVSARYLEGPLMESLIEESRFADLLITDAALGAATKQLPGTLLKQLLMSAKCPVIIAPALRSTISEIVFCYDGSDAALFAMKQFTYLLPELNEARGTVVQVKNDGLPADEKGMIASWLSNHYAYSDVVTLKGEPGNELFTYLLKKRHALVVMGAYGRSLLSNFLQHSQADLFIQSLTYPIFITH